MTPALVAGLLVVVALYRREIRRTEASENDTTDEFLAELAAIRQSLAVPPPVPALCAGCGRPPGPLSLFTVQPREV